MLFTTHGRRASLRRHLRRFISDSPAGPLTTDFHGTAFLKSPAGPLWTDFHGTAFLKSPAGPLLTVFHGTAFLNHPPPSSGSAQAQGNV